MDKVKIKLNKNYVNSKISAHILSENEMRKIGFSDYTHESWYYCKQIKFPNKPKYRNVEITFNVTIPKDGSDTNIEVLDEDFLQPYDYQKYLEQSPSLEPAIIVFDFVEKQMKFLQEKGILSGHEYGEYI